MTAKKAIDITDVERLIQVAAPDLPSVISAYLAQFAPEDEEEYDDDGELIVREKEEVPEGTITLDVLRTQLGQAARKREKKQRQTEAYDVWKRYLAQDAKWIAPQLQLAEMITALYDKRDDAASRVALVAIIAHAPWAFGVWGGIKRVLKRAEADFDAEIFGAINARIDTDNDLGDVSRGTQIYMRKRAWRYLRSLGKGAPELYPQFCVEVLRRYPADSYASLVGHKIERHRSKKWGGWKPDKKSAKFHAPFVDAWKRSADPLLLLLETCMSDFAASFAIDGLKRSLPRRLAQRDARVARASHHAAARERARSSSSRRSRPRPSSIKASSRRSACTTRCSRCSTRRTRRRASTPSSMPARTRPTCRPSASPICSRRTTARPSSSPPRCSRRASARSRRADARAAPPLRRLAQVGDGAARVRVRQEGDRTGHPRRSPLERGRRAERLGAEVHQEELPGQGAADRASGFASSTTSDSATATRTTRATPSRSSASTPIADVPADWLFDALSRNDIGDEIVEWLQKADALPSNIDVERLKGMVFDPSKRSAVLTVLGNIKLVRPQSLGLSWLLALARRADPQLHEWAHRYLLQHMKPEHFADGKPDATAGTARLFQLALGPKEPEAVRQFAQTYLRCHHPVIGKEEPETKQFGIKPALARTAYTMELLWPALWDNRADVRKFAATIARVELRKWNAQTRVYELGESPAKEVRNIAYDALMQAGDPDAPKDLALTVDELDPAQIFSMTESRKRSTRDVAMELIRKHYARIGGAERLGWLMQSADREVRLFAVRLLWEKHRPRSIPKTWHPAKGTIDLGDGEFADVRALRDLLRRLLFMIPPLRSAEAVDKKRVRKLPASVAKLHVIEIVRDFGMTDAAFAALVAPVLGEFTGSMAKGEWSACLAALVAFRSAHGLAIEGMVG